MDRRTFLLGFIGGIAAATGLTGYNTLAEARPIDNDPSIEPDLERVTMPEDSNDARAQYAQWGYYGPRRRYWRRARRRYWRRRYYGPRYYYGGPYRRHWRRVRRRYWRRRYW
jgi:hypothetical protein